MCQKTSEEITQMGCDILLKSIKPYNWVQIISYKNT